MESRLEEEELRYYNQDLFAKTALKILYERAQEEADVFKTLFKTRDALIAKAPENIVLRNTTEAFLTKLSLHNIHEESRKKYVDILSEIENTEHGVKTNTARKVKTGKIIFVHSLNNHLVAAAEHVSRYKKATLHMVNHHPHGTGEILYQDLKKRQKKPRADLSGRDNKRTFDQNSGIFQGKSAKDCCFPSLRRKAVKFSAFGLYGDR